VKPTGKCIDTSREVCDKLLDKSVPEKSRLLRAQAILMIGRVFRAAERDPGQADNGDYAFEQLLASSQNKKKKNGKSPDQQRKTVVVV
jgi:X-domain of DnaJ-containing